MTNYSQAANSSSNFHQRQFLDVQVSEYDQYPNTNQNITSPQYGLKCKILTASSHVQGSFIQVRFCITSGD